MLKTAILCAIGGIALIFIGNFGIPKTSPQNTQTRQIKPCFYVQPSRLNVREEPNLEAKITHQLQQNSTICEYSDTLNGFLRTQEGWIASKYLSLEPRLKPSVPQPNSTSNTSIAQKTRDSAPSLSYQESRKPKFKLTSVPKSLPTFANNAQIPMQNSSQDSTRLIAPAQDSTQTFPQPALQSPIIQARMELENQNYARAKTLALRANLANPKDLESWEIFVKSMYLEGKTQEAILVLQNFLQQNHDENLANLLKLMQQGQKI